MPTASERFKEARMASGMSQADAAAAAGISHVTYAKKEADPKKFTLEEVSRLHRAMTDGGRILLKDAVNFFDPSC